MKTKILLLTLAHFWWHFMNTVSEMREPCLWDAFEPSNKLHRQPRQYVKNDIRRQWMRNCWLRERERERGGDGFEIWIEWFICISLYMRKFIVAVKFGIVATIIWLFFFFLIGHWLLPFFLFFSFKYLYELAYILFRKFFAIT